MEIFIDEVQAEIILRMIKGIPPNPAERRELIGVEIQLGEQDE